MTLIFSKLLQVVKVHVYLQNFINKLSAAVHELSCSQRKKARLKTILPSLPRAVIKFSMLKYNNAIRQWCQIGNTRGRTETVISTALKTDDYYNKRRCRHSADM